MIWHIRTLLYNWLYIDYIGVINTLCSRYKYIICGGPVHSASWMCHDMLGLPTPGERARLKMVMVLY